MRKLIIIASISLLVLLGCASVASSPFAPEHTITKVIEVDKNSNDIYIVTQEWLARTINDSRASIEFFDKENGKIIGDLTGVRLSVDNPKSFSTYAFSVNFNFTIKDGKVRLIVSPISITEYLNNVHGANLDSRDFAFIPSMNSAEAQRNLINAIKIEITQLINNYEQFAISDTNDF